MKRILFLFTVIITVSVSSSVAQRRPQPVPEMEKPALEKVPGKKSDADIQFDPSSAVITRHSTTVKGQKFNYTATTGTQPVWDKDGKTIAGLFYVYYTRDDVKDRANRPLIISFNGGPGTGSVWMNIGFTGPRRLKIDNEGYPVQPYGVEENPYSVLDVADIVFVCPVNTGFSRIVDKNVPTSTFFGVNADITYLSEWISSFLSKNDRWESPKYLIGESYGTTRVSGLAWALQSTQWVYLNGVILVSPTDLGIERAGAVKQANYLPFYAATAWYHKALASDLQSKELEAMLPEVENFTINEYIPALAKGGSISDQEKMKVAEKVARYSGISQKVVLQNNLFLDPAFFWKELLRDRGFTVGRLDSRYLGIDKMDAGIKPDYNSELTSWLHSFTPAINTFLRNELGYKTDNRYWMFGPVRPWDNTNDQTGDDLKKAMLSNPGLHLMVLSGYYDGACDYFNAKYSMWQINQNGKLKDRMEWHGYKSGHMMYLRSEDLITSNQVIRDFMEKSTPKKGQPTRYYDPKGTMEGK
ncbi:MAG: carboxypeptidase [Ginsengibacter sp.]